MTDFKGGVTTVTVPADRTAEMPEMVGKARGRFYKPEERYDQVVVFVPEGTGREACKRIYEALGTAPKQSEAEFERDQIMGYEGNIHRMAEGQY